jgi:hypothetical protein
MDPDGSHVVTVHHPALPMADARWAPAGSVTVFWAPVSQGSRP